jgi:uncharacterized membrane protein
MLELLQMWALVEFIGLACLPLTMTVFRNVPDRGWAWSKSLGIVVLAFCTWFPLMIVQSIPYSRPVLIGIALLLLVIMLIGFWRSYKTVLQMIRTNYIYVLVTEGIFLGMLLIFCWVRLYGPNIISFETYMDEGFLASIMRGPNLPPHDMWYSGYSINYYYYGHYTIATLAKIIGQPADIAFNTGIIMLFGLTGVNLFGLTCNIVNWARHLRRQRINDAEYQSKPAFAIKHSLIEAMPYGILSILMGVVLGNMASAVQWWVQRGKPYDWFAPSRVIPNTINEFPSFSFLLSDFHAHVLALAFTILAMGVALNFLLEPAEKGLFVYGRGWRLPLTLVISALVMGELFVMNGWDMPTYLGLAVLCIALQQWLAYDKRIQWALVIDVLSAVISLVVLAYIFFLPFYLNFISPAQGIGIVQAQDRSPLVDELLIFGLFAFVFLSFLATSAFTRPLLARQSNQGALFSLPTIEEEFVDNEKSTSTTENELMDSEKSTSTTEGKNEENEEEESDNEALEQELELELDEDTHDEGETLLESLVHGLFWPLIGVCCGIGFIIIGLGCLLISPENSTLFIALGITILTCIVLLRHLEDRSHAFALLLGATAFALITGCEIFFLRDVFVDTEPRMNTIFKFYFQAWALFSVACGAGLYFIFERFQVIPKVSNTLNRIQMPRRIFVRGGQIVWIAVLIAFFLAGSLYPITAPYYRFLQVNPTNGQPELIHTNSLNGIAYMKNDPILRDDYYAINWINANIKGDPVIIETPGPDQANQSNDYTTYDRISAFTGLPTPMGWIGHEYQWRIGWYDENPANFDDSEQRLADIDSIYTNPDQQTVLSLMAKYHAQYIYVGMLEKMRYPQANLDRFASFMQVVYHKGNTTIYKVK